MIGDAGHGTSRSALWKLVLYDLTILRRSARAAFARKRDLLLLLVVVPLLLALVVRYAGEASVAVGQLHIGVQITIAAVLALIVNAAVGRRLAHLGQESVVARYALRPEAAALYAGCWNLLPIGILAGLMVASSPPLTVGAVLLAYLAGGASAAVQTSAMDRLRAWAFRPGHIAMPIHATTLRGVSRRQRAIALLVRRSGLFGPSLSANLLGLGVIGAMIGGLHLALASHLPGPAPVAVAGVLILLLLLASLRAHPSLLRYLTYLGLEPTLPAAVASALAAALLGGVLAVSIPAAFASPFAILAAAATLLLLFLAVALLRTLHFASKPRQSAEIAVQVEIAAFALVGYLAPPLAPAILIVRIWLLAREARALRSLVP